MRPIYDGGQTGRKESVYETAPLCEKYGITAMNIPGELLEDPQKMKEADACIKAHGMTWGMIPTPFDAYAENLSDEDFAAGLETLKRWAELAVSFGAGHCYNHIWNGSNSRTYDAQRDWVLNRARRVFEVLDPLGVHYGFEFLGPVPLRRSFKHPFFNNLAGALSIADEISPRLGFVFDTYHWYTGTGGDMGEVYLAAAHVDRLVNFHIDDGIPGRTREEQQDLEREMPLRGGVIDASVPYRLFKKNGYKGLIMCEPLNFWRQKNQTCSLEEVIQDLAKGYDDLAEAAK